MYRGRGVVGLVAIGLLAAACADASPGVVRGTSTRLPSDTVAPADEAPDTVPDAVPDTSAGAHDAELGLGDPFYPALGAPGLDVRSYDVHLRVDPGDPTLVGSETVTLAPLDPGDVLVLDAEDSLEITDVLVDGERASFTHEDDELQIEAGSVDGPQGPVVEISWTLQTRTGDVAADWTSTGWTTTPKGAVVLDEPDGLHRWMPANDHPSDKALWEVTIDVPDGTTAVSNGVLVDSLVTEGRRAWHWHSAEPMATYLVLVLIGDYDLVEDTTATGLPLLHAVAPTLRDDAQPLLDLTGTMIEALERWFGPYPFSTYGLAVSDVVTGVAMESQTRSLFGPDSLDPSTAVHELAHQWFGDAVTPAEWPDIWLNEGFATYAEWLARESSGTDIDSIAGEALRAGRAVAPAEVSVEEMFSPDVYSGGAIVLHALRREIGDEPFRTLLHRWVADHLGANATTEEFVTLAEEVAGRSLTEFFDAWLFTARPPDRFPN